MLATRKAPSGWRVLRLEDVAEVNPRRPKITFADEAHVTFLPMSAIADNFLGILARDQRPFRDVANGYTYFEEEDILFSKITPCLQNGKHALATGLSGGFGFGTTEFHVVRAGSQVTAQYMYRVLTQAHMIEQCRKSFTGTAGQQRVQPETLRSLPVLLPPLLEQRAIATVLDSIDEAIERTEAVVAATERLRDALLHELLTRGVPGWHSEWKDAPGIGTIPACWNIVRLEDMAKVERGKFAHRPRNEPRFYGGTVPFIQTSDVVQASRIINQHSQTLNDEGLAISRLFPAGTIVITIAANIGETAIAAYPMAFPDSLVGITPTGVDPSFLEYFLRTQKRRLNRFAPESAQKNINLEDIRPMMIPVPPTKEQCSIISVLDSTSNAFDLARSETCVLRSMKATAADALLSGRLSPHMTRLPRLISG